MCDSNRMNLIWHNCSCVEKTLILITGVLLSTIITDIWILNSVKKMIAPMKPEQLIGEAGICDTENCVYAANHILRSIDQSVEPCQDFYAYACNNWIKNNPIPEGKPGWGIFLMLEEQNRKVLKKLLERNEFNSTAMTKLNAYYLSCMDENKITDELGGEPIKQLIRDIGGWNITDSGVNITDWALQHALQTVHNRLNIQVLFNWRVGKDPRGYWQHILKIDQGGLTLPTPEHYLNTDIVNKVLPAYHDYMFKIIVLLGGDPLEVKYQMMDIIKFEIRLAQIATPSVKRPHKFDLITLNKLQRSAPFIAWRAYFEDAFQLVNRTFKDNDDVVVYDLKYLIDLAQIIIEYSATDDGKITINNYLIWRIIHFSSNHLSRSYRDAYIGFRKALYGTETDQKTWQYCVTDTNNVLGIAVNAIFANEVFDEDTKYQVQNMINEVRNAFKSNLPISNWMAYRASKVAEKMANNISDIIGIANSYVSNLEHLDKRYAELEINPRRYFQNNIQINKFNLKKKIEKLDQPVNQTELGMSLPILNAFYSKNKNEIVLPATILQKPFYDPKNPKSLNFGATGVIMGHELANAFEFQHRQYEREAKTFKWLDTKYTQRLKDRAACFEKQYSKYQINGKYLNGARTLRENIADNAGLKAAYYAFLRSKSTSDYDYLSLPGINLTHRQLFFVSYAQLWCSSLTNETLNLQVNQESYSPAKYRVMGSLSNLEEFSQEFNCVPGTAMNPLQKCEMW